VLGIGRSLVALASLSTLIATPTSTLFYRSPSFPDGFVCLPPTKHVLLPCATGGGGAWSLIWQLVLIAVLLVVVSGWRPRWTCIPHWLATFWFVNITPIPDGGDHLALVLSGLLIPLCLADDRRWHWTWKQTGQSPTARDAIGHLALVAIQIQAFFVYVHASVAKVVVAEWVDGTAIWYWSRQIAFGFPESIRPVTDELFSHTVIVAGVTWGSLFIEAFLVLAIVRGGIARYPALAIGLLFHLFIAITMGLVSFFLSAAALLTLTFGAPIASSMRSGVATALETWPRPATTKRSPNPTNPLTDKEEETCQIELNLSNDRVLAGTSHSSCESQPFSLPSSAPTSSSALSATKSR